MNSSSILFLIFHVVLFSWATAQGQEASTTSTDCMKATVEEKIVLHIDRNLYVTDENIHFKAHCFTNGTLSSPLSGVLYVELYNQQNQTFVQQKYALVEGTASGSFKIPEESRTGYYFLRAYTRYLRNFAPEQFAHQGLKIINPTSEGHTIAATDEASTSSTVEKNKSPKTVSNLKVNLNKSIYQAREQVFLDFDLPEEFAAVSVAVYPVAAGERAGDAPQIEHASILTNPPNLEFLPEHRGLNISGVLRDIKTQAPYKNEQCLISVVGKETQVHVTETDDEGHFTFHLQNLKDDQTLFISTKQKTDSTELLVFNDFSPEFANVSKKHLTFDSLQHQLIEDIYLNKQLEKAFPLLSSADEDASSQVASTPFHNIGDPDLIIETAEFIDLPSMEDIFRDIVPSVTMSGRIGSRHLAVFNAEINQTYDDPLVLLDNVPVSDIEALLKLNPSKVERIEVHLSNYILGDFLFGGVIMIKTNTDNFANFEWTNKSAFVEYKTLVEGDVFEKINFSDAQNQNSRQAVFRTTLHWNPKVDPATKKLDFFTSDYCTEYEVLLRGFTKDGQYGEGRAVFSVERKKS